MPDFDDNQPFTPLIILVMNSWLQPDPLATTQLTPSARVISIVQDPVLAEDQTSTTCVPDWNPSAESASE